MAEFKLSYTANEINERLRKIDSLAEKNSLPKKTSDLVNDSDFITQNYVKNYAQPIGDYALKSEIPDISSISSSAIIDVTELPTENINEQVFYRLLTGKFVYNNFRQDGYICYCVETLPEIGEAATNTDMSTVVGYYNISDGICYGYVDDVLSSIFGVPTGWYDVANLFSIANTAYGGVVNSMEDATANSTMYLVVSSELYSYKDNWTSYKKLATEDQVIELINGVLGEMVLITVDDIDAICGTTIQVATLNNEVRF